MRLSVRARLTAWYLAVVVAATLALAIGAWYLFRDSIVRAADASLATRVAATSRFIEAIQRAQLAPDELLDEFHEYAELTLGEALLEVTDGAGRVLCRPTTSRWQELRAPLSTDGRLTFADRRTEGRPFRAAALTARFDETSYQIFAAIPMGPEYAALARFGWLLIVLVPPVLVFAGAGGYWISGRALAPVDRMTQDVQSISLRHLDRRLAVPDANDELHRLAVTFNHMIARLQGAVADIVRFTAEASHELRTPVSLVRTTAEITLSRDRTSAEYREAFTDVLAQTERMSTLVADLLTLARADAGVDTMEMTPVDLTSMVAEVVQEVRSAVTLQGLTMTLKVSEPQLRLSGSRESLRRLWLILLDNAIKYTPRGGAVGVRVSRAPHRNANSESGALHPEPGTRNPEFGNRDAEPASDRDAVVVDVIDSGPGIDPADLPHVFERFYRGASARQRVPDGSGLGLSIARTIVERHRGSITIAAGAGGCGCHMQVRLPADVTLTADRSCE